MEERDHEPKNVGLFQKVENQGIGIKVNSLIIDDNRPVILCDEEDGIYKAQANGFETCGINVLDGKGPRLPGFCTPSRAMLNLSEGAAGGVL